MALIKSSSHFINNVQDGVRITCPESTVARPIPNLTTPYPHQTQLGANSAATARTLRNLASIPHGWITGMHKAMNIQWQAPPCEAIEGYVFCETSPRRMAEGRRTADSQHTLNKKNVSK